MCRRWEAEQEDQDECLIGCGAETLTHILALNEPEIESQVCYYLSVLTQVPLMALADRLRVSRVLG